MKRHAGFRRKSRHKMSKPLSLRGKIQLSRYFQEFQPGDGVFLVAEPAVQKGMYHPRFHGKKGIVLTRRGDAYEVQIHDGTVKKSCFIHPVHLKKEVMTHG